TDLVLLELSRVTLSDYLERRPNAAMDILRIMAERLRQTDALLSERAAKNVDEEIEKNLTWSDRLPGRWASFTRRSGLLFNLFILTLGWTLANSLGLVGRPFDPYPYVFYNLVLAILVALQGPLIVMSQNRQGSKDHARAETDFKVNLKNEVNIETILRELGEFRAKANRRLGALESR